MPKEYLRKKWFDLGDKIKRLRPRVVVCLGEEPLRAVTNKHGIKQWRGTRIEAYGTKVIATYHPANVLRAYTHRVIVEMDLRKAKREAEGFIYTKPDILIAPSLEDVLSWCQSAAVCKARVSFDIETIGKHVRCIGFAQRPCSGIRAICIPFMRMVASTQASFSVLGNGIVKSGGLNDVNYWSAKDEELVLEAIASVLEDGAIEKVGQNSIHFDAPIIRDEFGIAIKNHKMDTMHAWHVLYPSLGMEPGVGKQENEKSGKIGLKFISSIVTDHPNYWTEHDPSNDASEWYYNGMDCVTTLEISEKVDEELDAEGLRDLYYNHVHPLAFALLRAQERGVTFDKKEAGMMKKEMNKELIGTQRELNELVGEEFNPNSPKQVQHLLYEKLRFPAVYHHKTKKKTANEDAILKLHAKYPNEPALVRIIEYRKIAKLIGTFLDVKLDEDGVMRCAYNASGTITGRISSSKTLWGTGMNLENIPKGYTPGVISTRHLYIARPGHVFVIGDLKQAEAMVVAWILKSLGDPLLYDKYKDPSFDIHRWCASRFVYRIPEDQVTKEQRQQGGKLANHSGNYMAGPGVMERRARQMGYDGFGYRECKEILERRTSGIPGLKKWWADVEMQVKSTRMLKTCFGRRLHFFGRLEGDELRSAVAFEPQSTVADVGSKILLEMDALRIGWPVLTTYDEVVVEAQEGDAELVAQAMLKATEIPLSIRSNVEPLIIPIEIAIGKNWKDTEEWKQK